LRIGQVFSVSWQTVCKWVTTNCCFMSETLLHAVHFSSWHPCSLHNLPVLKCAFSNYTSLYYYYYDFIYINTMHKLTFVWRSMSQLSSKSSSSSPNGFINCSATYHRIPVINDHLISNKYTVWEPTSKRLVNSFTSHEQFWSPRWCNVSCYGLQRPFVTSLSYMVPEMFWLAFAKLPKWGSNDN
jgi:hypothetical protein